MIFVKINTRRINYDLRKDQYQAISKMGFADIEKFHQQELANKSYTYCVVASEEKVKEEDLKKMGEVRKLGLEEIFGY
jgi:hypothetical protein